jgi:hypothetical protein
VVRLESLTYGVSLTVRLSSLTYGARSASRRLLCCDGTPLTMNTRTSWSLPILALALGLGGCNRTGLVDAEGRLTHKGRPVPSTLITFLPDDGGRPSHGLTNDDGHFSVTYSRSLTGLKRGHYSVALRYDVSVDEELGRIKPKASKELKAVIARYGDPKTSGLQVDITKSGQVIEINLE